MRRALRTARANADLKGIWRYIARDDSAAATRLLQRIERVIQSLADFPATGQLRPELAEGVRFYPVGAYLIFYTVQSDRITVLRVIHGARDYRRHFS